MNELTAEWVAKAEGDYATAGREPGELREKLGLLKDGA
jgi:hypothetical protein